MVTGNHSSEINNLIHKLGCEFSLKDLGALHFFLGIEVTSQSSGIMLNQRQYIVNLIKQTNMLNCSPVQTPILASTQLSKVGGEPYSDPIKYCQVVSAL